MIHILKIKALLFIVFLSAFIANAQNNPPTPKFNVYKGDTINRVDKSGLRQGVWRKFYENDTMFYEGNYQNDKRVGEFKHYYRDGKLKAVSQYSENGHKAYVKNYHKNGKLMAEGVYIDEKKDGTWN